MNNTANAVVQPGGICGSDSGAEGMAAERLAALLGLEGRGSQAAPSNASGLLVLDGRSHRSRARGHLPGSHHIPAGLLVSGEWPEGELLLVTESDAQAERIREAMHEAGYARRIRHLAGGFPAWQAAGLPVSRSGPLPTGVWSLAWFQRLQAAAARRLTRQAAGIGTEATELPALAQRWRRA